MLTQSALTFEALAAIWTEVRLAGMMLTPVLDQIVEVEEFLFALVTLM